MNETLKIRFYDNKAKNKMMFELMNEFDVKPKITEDFSTVVSVLDIIVKSIEIAEKVKKHLEKRSKEEKFKYEIIKKVGDSSK